ncbi:hypothetical protein [Streptomyces sp. NBC_01615]|uniref:hypothetical protein n=1 Tax=Streptomyces sp. NBC_01615 TaxID=2975898 RepID=UPI0038697261
MIRFGGYCLFGGLAAPIDHQTACDVTTSDGFYDVTTSRRQTAYDHDARPTNFSDSTLDHSDGFEEQR